MLKLFCAMAFAAGGLHCAMAAEINAQQPWPLQDHFDTPPVAAVARKGSSCEVEARYVALMDAHRAAEVGELFAEDAVLLDWDGVLRKGKKAIGDWYAATGGPKRVIPLSFVDAGPDCFAEVATVSPRATTDKFGLSAMNHVTVDADGKIKRAVYYLRPYVIRTMAPMPPAAPQAEASKR